MENWTEENFEDWKKNLQITNSEELYEAVCDLAVANNWPLRDDDPLGLVVGESYFCLGDPCSSFETQIEAPVSEFEIVEEDDHYDEVCKCDSQYYYIIY